MAAEAAITKRRRVFAGSLIGTLAAAVVFLYALRTPVLRSVGDFLVVRDNLAAADAIVVLNGDPNSRPFEAARLFRQGLASEVWIARSEDSELSRAGVYPNTTDLAIAVLKKGGVPAGHVVQIETPGGVTSTFDEARALHEYVMSRSIRKIIVVTSAFHTRRAHWALRKEFRGTNTVLLMWPVPNPKYGADNWWRYEDGVIGLQNEYLKLLYYIVRH